MKAAVCRVFGQPLTIEEVVLRAPAPGEVHVAVEAVAICQSDLSYIDGAWPCVLPAVFGHEAAGRVVALGAGVTGYAPGDAVVVSMIRACGQCRACRRGRPTLCSAPPDRRSGVLTLPDGTLVEQGLGTGAFAEAVVVQASQIAPIPVDLPMPLAALLACGVITGTGAVINTARVEPGSICVVIGAGGVGLNTIQGARIAGARQIIAIDLSDEKLQTARDFGATDGLRADIKGLRRAVLDLTGGEGADYVFVTVGAISAYQGASALAARGGVVVVVGMPPSGATMSIEPVILAATAQSLVGSYMGGTVLQRDIPWLIDQWRRGALELEALVSGRFALEQINEAMDQARAGLTRRNVIVMGR